MDASFSTLNFNSVETLPGYEARAAFTVNSASVFKEDVDIVPTIVDDSLSYMPWGGDNQMPFDILGLIENRGGLFRMVTYDLCVAPPEQA